MTRMSLAERRQKLIEAALAVIARDGVPAATTRAIAGEAGMPLASFHYAFESHQVLLSEATRLLMQAELDRLGRLDVAAGSPRELVRNLLAAQLAAVKETPEHFQSLAELIHHAYRAEGQRDMVMRWRKDREAKAAERLTTLAQSNGVELGGDVLLMSRALLAMADGLVDGMLVNGDVEAGKDAIDYWVNAAA